MNSSLDFSNVEKKTIGKFLQDCFFFLHKPIYLLNACLKTPDSPNNRKIRLQYMEATSTIRLFEICKYISLYFIKIFLNHDEHFRSDFIESIIFKTLKTSSKYLKFTFSFRKAPHKFVACKSPDFQSSYHIPKKSQIQLNI